MAAALARPNAVFSELAGKHLGIADGTELFSGWGGKRLALLR